MNKDGSIVDDEVFLVTYDVDDFSKQFVSRILQTCVEQDEIDETENEQVECVTTENEELIVEYPEWLQSPPPRDSIASNMETTFHLEDGTVAIAMVGILPPLLIRHICRQRVSLPNTNGTMVHFYQHGSLNCVNSYTIHMDTFDVNRYECRRRSYANIIPSVLLGRGTVTLLHRQKQRMYNRR